MVTRPVRRWLMALALLMAGPAIASPALWQLEKELQGCIQTSGAAACRRAQALVNRLKTDPAYGRSSHLCKEEISELEQVLALLPMRDAVPTEVMASVADVQQACLPYGF